ncbi:TIR domain-containing protein [Bradyrhizobium arachidis]|nr:TIR domain-containing protein [Bradyrhizobium arachidis]
MSSPVAFISYCWSSPKHEQWVMELATELVNNGIEVRLDKWDLREGQDAHAYMESMVTDPKVTKVLVICDKKYADKADKRAGGVGTESQIMSAEIYNKTEQTKFVAIVPEVDENGEPYLPRFFTSRVYILMTEALYGSNFEQLLRWLYDKPLYVKPAIGKMPTFLKEDQPIDPTRSRAKRAAENASTEALVQPSLSASSLDSYLGTLVSALKDFYIDPSSPDFPQATLDSIEDFLPYRNEFIEVLITAAPRAGSETARSLQRFFEQIIPFMSRPESITHYRTWDWDNFKFIIHELFLYTIGILLKYERFDVANELIELRFFIQSSERRDDEAMQPYSIIWSPLEALRPKEVELRRISLRADLLEQRSHTSGIPFAQLMVADFILFLRATTFTGNYDHWYPETLLYSTIRFRPPFELFARSESKRFFSKLAPVIGVKDKAELEQLAQTYSLDGAKGRWLPRWQYNALNVSGLANLDKLETRP